MLALSSFLYILVYCLFVIITRCCASLSCERLDHEDILPSAVRQLTQMLEEKEIFHFLG